MRPTLRTAALQLLACLALVVPAQASSVLSDVARTGVLKAGTSKDAFPFAYQNAAGELVGYSVDILNLIRRELEAKTGRPIRLKLQALSADERIPSLEKGSVAIICDASSFTWARDEKVDFSVSYGITGTQLLVPSGSNLALPESLSGKRIGALAGTTSAIAIAKAQPAAELVFMRDREDGYRALGQGTIDAFADDGILLRAWLQRQGSSTASNFRVTGTYSKEGIACMLPEDNSAFGGIVNLALIRYMHGFLDGRPEPKAIFERWFGTQSETPMTQDMRSLFVETMQLMVDFKEDPPPPTP
jgi:polar amino acid transport system substrate-binding protein